MRSNLSDDFLDIVSKLIEVHCPGELAEQWWQFLQDVSPDQAESIAERKARRNEHLREAYSLMRTPSVRGVQLRIVWFATDIWPGVKTYKQPPKSLTAIERELFFAFACKVTIPTSTGQLHKIVFGNSAK